jgi:hypothetical protein
MGLFRRIFGKADSGLVYGSSENPRPLQLTDAIREDLESTAEHLRELKDFIPIRIKEVEDRMRAAKALTFESYAVFSSCRDEIIEKSGGDFWRAHWHGCPDTYPAAETAWAKYMEDEHKITELYGELHKWEDLYREAYGRDYISSIYDEMNVRPYDQC